ncbi:MAG: hypothetical protein A3H27_10815 [Acidobacteria bacterium RIFCSPLOWO2_02_FULL_59_13]|nr:MAG: hypothetical protein A3H27_10815 [Acidobacteria bacterium RIFCSPLOWO2_02_FULL_59_13]OGA60800.1 MAG: hypothetical protein A3G81_23775 [Betaproteobacteria bacterium RIFCSPLOWO2_12_FULL_65_14]
MIMSKKSRNEKIREYATYALGFAAMFATWHLLTKAFPSVLFPTPTAVIAKAIELAQTGALWENLGVSLGRIFSGFLVGVSIGIPVGLIMGNFHFMRRLLEPFTEFLRFIPSVAMITVAVIWFGIGEFSKVFLIAYTTVFIVIISTAAGVMSIHIDKIRAAQTLGASRAQIFLFVSLPAAMPGILTGLRVAMGNSFTTIVAAEMVAADTGLGTMLWHGRLFMLIDQIFVALLILGLVGFLADRVFRVAIRYFGGKYSAVI